MRRIYSINKGINRRKAFVTPFKLYRLKWTIHLYDVDQFPSIPHGHNEEKRLKLDLFEGSVYKYKKIIGKVDKKELEKLHENERFKEVVKIAQEYHKNRINTRKAYALKDNLKFEVELSYSITNKKMRRY